MFPSFQMFPNLEPQVPSQLVLYSSDLEEQWLKSDIQDFGLPVMSNLTQHGTDGSC